MSEAPYTIGPHITDRDAWLAAHDGVTGSGDSYIVVTGKPLFGRTIWDLYLLAIGEKERDDLSGVESIKLGNALEDWVSQRFLSEAKAFAVQDRGPGHFLRSLRWPRLGCTPDFFIRKTGADVGVLECKTSGTLMGWEEGPPEHYWAQVQHQLAVTGLKYGAIAILAGGIGGMKFRWAWIERDDRYIEDELVPVVEEFWRRVEAREPYPVDGTEACTHALGKLWEPEPGKLVALDGAFTTMDDRLQELDGLLRQLKFEETELKNRIREAIGSAETAVLPNGVRYSYKEQSRQEHIVKASTFRVLRRSEAR